MPKVQKKKIVGEGADGVTAKKEGTRKSQRLESQAKATIPPKKAAPKKAAEVKGKKAAKGKKEEKAEDAPAENGEPKTEEETDAATPTAEGKE
ncbi:hypothetical protein SKAU_G00185380 [Synaphobranchus kaupii]|uniref:High mobility group nucleosome-binding domain-containing protein 3 n=1 Tax=Synaphobranchus kaupii TaxID=118154 RepID=A0A9Q1FCM0_SYNKA|nr:hypothetical protein SKAU_G00185380 [Synaphobranchus kaupii]